MLIDGKHPMISRVSTILYGEYTLWLWEMLGLWGIYPLVMGNVGSMGYIPSGYGKCWVYGVYTLWLFDIAMVLMAHRNRWFTY